jgi:surfactin synthase thioesterase subunit
VPVQLPGREQRVREAAEPNLLRLIDRLAPEVAPFTSSRYSLFGHSMGALVAFELARALRRLGCQPPDHLFLAGRGAPGMAMPKRPIHMLPDREFVEEIRQLRGTPDAVIEHAEFTSLFLPALRADFALVETYTCPSDAPLASPISVFGGVDDAIGPDALEGWRAHTAGDFELHMLPGGHFLVASARQAILGAIANELGRRGRIQVSP